MDYKELNRKAYDATAAQYEKNTQSYLEKFILNDATLFLDMLKGKKILDVGSGPGRDSVYFKGKGFEPCCIDISESMVALCREKGLEAHVMDLETMHFPENSFHGAWAYTSLVHVPKKNMQHTLHILKNILVPQGALYLGMKEGTFEGIEYSQKIDKERFFSYYSKEELENLLQKDYTIRHFSRVISDDNRTFINFLCEAK